MMRFFSIVCVKCKRFTVKRLCRIPSSSAGTAALGCLTLRPFTHLSASPTGHRSSRHPSGEELSTVRAWKTCVDLCGKDC